MELLKTKDSEILRYTTSESLLIQKLTFYEEQISDLKNQITKLEERYGKNSDVIADIAKQPRIVNNTKNKIVNIKHDLPQINSEDVRNHLTDTIDDNTFYKGKPRLLFKTLQNKFLKAPDNSPYVQLVDKSRGQIKIKKDGETKIIPHDEISDNLADGIRKFAGDRLNKIIEDIPDVDKFIFILELAKKSYDNFSKISTSEMIKACDV